jgi:MinD-like ATPase involved in chromosome partitioning or flagellar assembly
MARPVRTSNLLKETAADHENLDRMADQERLAVNRAATQPPVQENESVIEKAEEKEPSVQEKLDAILPDDFFGEFEDLFNSEDVHIKEQIKQDMSPDILLKAPATVTDDGAAQAVSEAAEEKADEEEIAQAVNENTAEKTGKEISVEAVEKAEEALRPEPAAAKTEKMPDLLPDIQTQEPKPTVTAGRKALVEPIPETREPEKVIRRMSAEEDLTPMHTINRAVRRTYKQIGLSQPVTSVSLQQMTISVYSPKGGVGKSTIVRELAHVLSDMKRNGRRLKILVLDADWEFGDVDSAFGICPSPNVMDWVKRICKDRECLGYIPAYSPVDIVSRYVIEYDDQIHILAGSDNAMEAARLDCGIAEVIMDNLRRCDYDLILVDNCNTLKDTTVIPLEKSDLILLILSLDTSTVQDARNFLDALSEFRIEKSNIRMVINQVPLDDKKCELGISHVARILNMEPTCIIHTNQDARSFANVGEAASSDKRSLFSKEIRALARIAVAVDEEPEKPDKGSGGFWRRLFGRKR